MNNDTSSPPTEDEEQKAAFHYRIQMYKLVIPIFLGLSLLAILANTLVILALRSARVRRNATVTLLLSLTSSDIWSSIVVAMSLFYNSYLPIVLQTEVNPCMALSLEMLRTGGLLTAALHLLLIALHHCVGIIRPHCDKARLRRGALALCLGAWLVPPGALWLLALAHPGQGFWNCTRVDFYHSRAFRWSVSALLAAIFCAITLCYAKLLFILRAQHGKWPNTQQQRTQLDSSGVGGQSPPQGGAADRKRRRRQRRTLWTTLLICASFLLGWAPASAVFALTCADCRVLSGPGLFRWLFALSCTQLAFLLAKSLLNPLIYSLRIPEVNAQIRQCAHQCTLINWCWCSTKRALPGSGRSMGVVNLVGGGGSARGGESGRKLKKFKQQRSHLFNSSVSSSAREEGGRQSPNRATKRGRPRLATQPGATNPVANGHGSQRYHEGNFVRPKQKQAQQQQQLLMVTCCGEDTGLGTSWGTELRGGGTPEGIMITP